ncbi:MAG TPA: site-2 protease family protein [Gemmataceae bacterium]|nr:site-2 protease family protein [Gemmataceae bacterium]
MDTNTNPGTQPMSDIATPGPIDPNSGQPDHKAEVSALKAWFRQNLVTLVITAVVVALVIGYLDPIDTLKVVIGLGLVIFIHELGHFLAAKWCDVHVKTFSIGFGPAIPFCSYKWGETTYMLGIIPLGGYVSMVGENTGEGVGDADPDEEENDPRSFRNKSVGRRMLIISAGVIMNVFLGMLCFMAAYLHGVQEKPATVGWVESGGAAWRAGVRTDDDIIRIGSRENPFFNDIRPIVMSTRKGEKVEVVLRRPDGTSETVEVEPLRDEGALFPQMGVAPPFRLTLVETRKRSFRPVTPGTPAAAAEPRFEQGDRIVAMSDPDKNGEVTPLPPDREGRPDFDAFHKRMVRLAGQPVMIHVLRRGERDGATPTAIKLAPALRADLGLRMRMGEVVAVRRGSPAEKAGVQAHSADGTPVRGDKIKAVKLPAGPDGRQTWFVVGGAAAIDWAKPEFKGDRKAVDVKPLDPVLLPLELNRWADGKPASWQVKLVVLRQQGHTEDDPVELTLDYDPSFRFDREIVNLPNSPLPISGLGLAYWVEPVVNDKPEPGSPAADPDPVDSNAARPGSLELNDVVSAVRFKSLDADGNVKTGDWDDVKEHQWAAVEASFQRVPPHQIDLRIKRGEQTFEVTLKGRPDTNWPTEDRGLIFQPDFRVQKADSIGDAINLGVWRTGRFIRDVYMNLYGMIRGRISAKTMSGPITIATVSYKIAGEDLWQFLLFLGLISVNLAVVNFLPIPVLDGGHMVFLIYEKIFGRPLPERVFAFAMYIGLALILSLMVFVLWLDIRRVFFGWL